MRAILSILILLPLFISCSSDSNGEPPVELTQDYTSIVVENKTGLNLYNIVLGSYDGNKYSIYQKIGDVKQNESTDEIVLDNIEPDVYLFYLNLLEVVKLNNPIVIKKNNKNTITITRYTPGKVVEDWTDPTQYPH